jgi:hypothetical protein
MKEEVDNSQFLSLRKETCLSSLKIVNVINCRGLSLAGSVANLTYIKSNGTSSSRKLQRVRRNADGGAI